VRLFLFDIDGTLVSVRGAGRAAFARALEATYGTAGTIDRYDFRGRTDLSIVHELMTEAGLDAERIRARVDECFQAYAHELTRIIGDGSRIQVLPGVAEVIRRLGARSDAVVGLLTGNIEAGARIKLEPTGLWPFFRVAAYGGDHADRLCLPAIACERARALGHEFTFDRVTIIGDTPLDVACAKVHAARAVGVATGPHAIDELRKAGADVVFADLSETTQVLRALNLKSEF
jgi:phosphoglycolate phosphatase-like HAD superfamily hydrolase